MTNPLSRRTLLGGTLVLTGSAVAWTVGVGPAQAQPQARVRVPPSADTFVDSDNPETNFGQDVGLIAGQASSASQQVVYLRFPIDRLHSGPIALQLTGAHAAEYAIGVAVHHVVDTSWSETGLTWSKRPTPGTEPLDTRLVDGLSDYTYEWDVTAAVDATRSAGAPEVGLALVLQSSTANPITFAAREATSAGPTATAERAEPERRSEVKARRNSPETQRTYLATALDAVPDFTPGRRAPNRSRYGGRTDEKFEATGFFRTYRSPGRRLGRRWYLVDPEGHPFYWVGLASTRPPLTPESQAFYREKFDDDADWAAQTTDFLRQLGFNSTGGFSADTITRAADQPLPYTPVLAVMNDFAESIGVADPKYGNSAYRESAMPAWHPDFPAYADSYLRDALTAASDDPWCVGYFSDNELPMSTAALANLLTNVEVDDPELGSSAREARDFFRDLRGGDADPDTITDTEAGAWHGHVLDRYYRVITPLFREYDPNHLFLGSRLHSRAPRTPDIIAAAGRHVDVVSINYYDRWEARDRDLDMWAEQSPNAPVVITEFYVKGADSDLPPDVQDKGAGWIVSTQADRGTWYQNICLGMMAHPHTVGWHDFKYSDEYDDSNKGIYDYRFELYQPFLDKVSALNREVYRLLDYYGRRRR